MICLHLLNIEKHVYLSHFLNALLKISKNYWLKAQALESDCLLLDPTSGTYSMNINDTKLLSISPPLLK